MISKVIVRILGGTGNQLFGYAASRRLALVNNAQLVIDDVTGFKKDLNYKRQYQLCKFNIKSRKATSAERLEPFSRTRRFILRTWNRNRKFVRRSYIRQEGVDFDPRLLEIKFQGKIYLEGYWQSENYFKDVGKIIREDLRIKPPSDDNNSELAKRILASRSVAIHVRFFDAPGANVYNNASTAYYTNAVNLMEGICPKSHYYVFSDYPKEARSLIHLPSESVTYVSHNIGEENSYADLWLMSLCDNFIIANSSFSWWGAWLAKNLNKKIIVPGFEKRDGISWWGFKGLIPDSWIKL